MTVPTVNRRAHRDMDEGGQETFSWSLFCDAVLDAYEERGISPVKLAERMGASHEAVARWMAGIAVPKPGYLKHASQILGKQPEDFYE